MYTRHLCVSANDVIGWVTNENSDSTRMLGELADDCVTCGKEAVAVHERDGKRFFVTGEYCGFAFLTDGTLIEILPRTEGGTAEGRRKLCAELCSRCGYTYDPSAVDVDMNFMEYFISVFAEETIRIIKSGVLSAYASREENLTAVQGTIMFSENIRRNLVHRERIYVRHDVFTPDRAENRIIKAAAAMLVKLTANPRSSHLLKETLSFLDEVRMPYDIAAEFGKCINTRNTKKYSTTLSICRMLFDRNEGTAFSGDSILCAQFYKMCTQPQVRKKRVKVVRRKRI